MAVVVFQEEVLQVAGENSLPSWLKKFIDQKGVNEIENHIMTAEKRTQAEIVPMIVRSSSTMGYLPFHIFMILALIHMVFFRDLPHHGIFILLVVSMPTAILLSKISFIQRLLIPTDDQILDVHHRAHFEFFENKLSHTEQRLGVLIFVSLMEHRCVILADEWVASKVDPSLWQKARDSLIRQVKKNNAAQGFAEAIDLCAEILEKEFPAQQTNSNELKNHLIISQ